MLNFVCISPLTPSPYIASILLLLSIIHRSSPVYSQVVDVPSITCPQFFEYLSYDGNFIGKITLPSLQIGETIVAVKLSQRFPTQRNYFGKISLFYDQDITNNKIHSGEPVAYRVDFPLSNVIPKLTEITVNGRVICAASDYPAPSTSISLHHILRTSTHTFRGTVPFRNFFNDSNGFISTIPKNDIYDPPRPRVRPTEVAPTPHKPIWWQPQADEPGVHPPTTAPTRAPVAAAVCGQEGGASTFTPLIHGGTVLRRGQFPWLTAIYQKQTSGTRFLCGGSLISSRTIISAAHCFQLTRLTADRITVFLGRYNLNDYMEEGVVSRDIETLLTHPEYDALKYTDADIALLQLVVSVSFNDFIRPICLWTESNDVSLIEGEAGVVAGWGGDENGNTVSQLPKMVPATVVSEGTCLRSSQLFIALTSERTLCAGDRDGTGPCIGDSGGGLILKRDGRWTLRGLVSAGSAERQRCDLQVYVIYCDVAKHLAWVQRSMLI